MDISGIRLKHTCLIGDGRYDFWVTVPNVCNVISRVEVFNSMFVNQMRANSTTEMERSGIGVRYGDGFAQELMAQVLDLFGTSDDVVVNERKGYEARSMRLTLK